ncbi:MAG: C10 family peptidase [bacterium]|jgi:hypothetical protein|nr:C10 family peptidase [Candidatus Neomarinimicrobiota bacterium]MDX9779933.1 C10 family peptidase [bacterium]
MRTTLRRLSFILAGFVFLFGRPVNPDEAEVLARKFFPQKNLHESRMIGDALYLYHFYEGGFLLIAAEDGVPAVLAFSETGKLQREHPAFLEFCEQYRCQIRDASDAALPRHSSWQTDTPAFSKLALNSEIQPIISSTWNQAPYYNQYFPYFTVPAYSDRRAYAGCVAVTAGQLMRHYRHPAKGVGYREYYSNDTDSLLSVAFDTAYYDWDIMPDSLTTRYGGLTAGMDQVREVGQLLFQIAVSVEMELKPDGSSASFDDLIYSLVSYFDYSPEMQILKKGDFTETSWRSMLTQELTLGYPLAYSGQGSGGHAFLCDGYRLLSDSLHYFHINWGWGGAYDGWFLLTALTPAAGYDYSNEQQAIFYIRPNGDAITRLAYSGFEGWQSSWIYDGFGFVAESGGLAPHSGNYSYTFNAAEQWMITPKIYLPDSDSIRLSFWSKMLNSGKQCKVMLSQTDTLHSSFTVELGTIAPHDQNWREYVFDLSPYKNSGIHIGFRYTSAGGYIAIDDLTISMQKIKTAVSKDIPVTFTMLRNYPNPFNASTQIAFVLPRNADVQLNIFDIHGKLLQTVINGSLEAGRHQYFWNGGELPSGIYFCSLLIDGIKSGTQKMLLVK